MVSVAGSVALVVPVPHVVWRRMRWTANSPVMVPGPGAIEIAVIMDVGLVRVGDAERLVEGRVEPQGAVVERGHREIDASGAHGAAQRHRRGGRRRGGAPVAGERERGGAAVGGVLRREPHG